MARMVRSFIHQDNTTYKYSTRPTRAMILYHILCGQVMYHGVRTRRHPCVMMMLMMMLMMILTPITEACIGHTNGHFTRCILQVLRV